MSSSGVNGGLNEVDACSTIEPKKSKHKKHHKKKESKRKSKRSHSSDSSSVSSDKRKKKKVKSKKHKKLKREKSNNDIVPMSVPVPAILQDLPTKSKIMKPMTKEEWEQQQNTVRRVIDPVTGRKRLIKGDGEVLEEIVSKDKHKQINREATIGDGTYFQNKMTSKEL